MPAIPRAVQVRQNQAVRVQVFPQPGTCSKRFIVLGSASRALRRLMQEQQSLKYNPPTGITAQPEEGNLMRWTANITGENNTPWAHRSFRLRLEFTENYPETAPSVKFMDPVFHPNVYQRGGQICMDVLGMRWRPVIDIGMLLVMVQQLLNNPNLESPANTEAASLFQIDKTKYDEKIRQLI
eukprot:TRINITY_DN16458_c0_g1_i1.p1 TRINITY_DN16458_c0_g1~~TRINITY_DN16458_c0_g1_i1.p1  ORF type:complete len:182 (-),score=23.59 TRINITY_DN16458_c0_g1_i1:394-939(-)